MEDYASRGQRDCLPMVEDLYAVLMESYIENLAR